MIDLSSCRIIVYDSKLDQTRDPQFNRALQLSAKMIPRLLEEAQYVEKGLKKDQWQVL